MAKNDYLWQGMLGGLAGSIDFWTQQQLAQRAKQEEETLRQTKRRESMADEETLYQRDLGRKKLEQERVQGDRKLGIEAAKVYGAPLPEQSASSFQYGQPEGAQRPLYQGSDVGLGGLVSPEQIQSQRFNQAVTGIASNPNALDAFNDIVTSKDAPDDVFEILLKQLEEQKAAPDIELGRESKRSDIAYKDALRANVGKDDPNPQLGSMDDYTDESRRKYNQTGEKSDLILKPSRERNRGKLTPPQNVTVDGDLWSPAAVEAKLASLEEHKGKIDNWGEGKGKPTAKALEYDKWWKALQKFRQAQEGSQGGEEEIDSIPSDWKLVGTTADGSEVYDTPQGRKKVSP